MIRKRCRCLPATARSTGGQFESQQSASRRLLVLSIGVVAALFMLLVLAFGRASDGVLVMLNLRRSSAAWRESSFPVVS
jgi:Cu/Ag efflux pump CusA